MKYMKAIELWGIEDQLRAGSVKLQPGQHVTCGGTKARYAGVRGHSIWVAYTGETAKFRKLIATLREDKRQL